LISRGRALGWSAVFLGGGLIISLAILFVVYQRLSLTGGALWLAAVQSLVMLIVFGALTWSIGRRRLAVDAQALGLRPAGAGATGLLRGFLLGAIIAGIALLLGVPTAGAAWQLDGGTPAAWARSFSLTALVLFPAAFVEELIFRGAPLMALSRSFGRIPAIVGLSTLFGLAHLSNPDVTALGVANIILAGVFLGVVFFTPGGLWTSTGAHLGWNLTLAGLAAPVSGLPIPMPWLDYAPGGPAWLTGGPFGPEGGLLATLCLLGGCMVAGRHVTQEKLA
jgi:membrane protease YdiL (CAAX protease family)